jgi:exonuclease III
MPSPALRREAATLAPKAGARAGWRARELAVALTLATWNVNSLKVRMPHLLTWLATRPVDIVCLQETKLTDENFPRQQLLDIGYRSYFAGQKTYNGVAILVRTAALGEAQAVSPHCRSSRTRKSA